MNWKGEILLETLSDASVLDALSVARVEEIRDADGLWHNYHVSVKEAEIAILGAFLKDGPWFMHFVRDRETAVVFKNAFFVFSEEDEETRRQVKEYAKALRIPEEELQFAVSS